MDFERLDVVAETDQEKTAFLALFFRLGNECAADMEKACHEHDLVLWGRAAHSLKGAAANLGMCAVEEACQQAERGAGLDKPQRTALLLRVKDELHKAESYIRKHYPKLMHAEGRYAV